MGDGITKHCTKCGVTKPSTDFARSKSRKDGLNGHCKRCIAAWRLANLDAVRAKKKQYAAENADRNAARAKAWREANPERAKDGVRRWVSENGDRKAAVDREYRTRNAERVAQQKSAYYQANREREVARNMEYARVNRARLRPLGAEAAMRRFAKKRAAVPRWANKDAVRLFYEDASRRSAETGQRWEVDHIVPLQSRFVCGLHCEANLRVIPRSDNRSKSNRTWPDQP